jgi:hypothetical protein
MALNPMFRDQQGKTTVENILLPIEKNVQLAYRKICICEVLFFSRHKT